MGKKSDNHSLMVVVGWQFDGSCDDGLMATLKWQLDNDGQ